MTPPRAHQLSHYKLALELKASQRQLLTEKILTLVVPGGGKSALPVIYAVSLIPQHADKLCWVVPRESLRKQAEESFNEQWLREWLGDMRQIRSSVNDRNPSRGTHGYVTTYQAISANPDLHQQEFDTARYILVLDEVHHVERDGLWHKVLQPLVDRARLLVLMTGTLERGDGRHIAFVDYRSRGTVEVPDTRADRSELPFVAYTRADALADRAILPITFNHFDLSGEWINRQGQRRTVDTFDDVPEDESSDALGAGLATSFAYQLLSHCTRDWLAYRHQHPHAQLLVVAHRQSTAKEYVSYLKNQHAVRGVVAVSDDGADAQEAIRRFRHRHVDALVTVGMAYEGLDAPGISHIACLTHIRSKPWIEQMFGRGVRVDRLDGSWDRQMCFAYVPDDPLMRQVIEQIKDEQEPFVRERREQRERNPPEAPGNLIALDGVVSGFRVTELDGEALDQQESERLQRALELVGLSGTVSPVQFARALRVLDQLPETPASVHRAVTVSDAEEKLRTRIENAARRIDATTGQPFGTTNRDLVRRFGKSRDDMTNDELQKVWAYLNSRYPEFAL